MSASTLRDNLDSDYFKAYAALLPKSAAKPILVYVESHEDIAFWGTVLEPFEGGHLKFEIQLASNTDFSKGKAKVLTHRENVGPYFILCVDSDLDYLLPDSTEDAVEVNANPYIFHTYAHSIENHYCYAPAMHALCRKATLNPRKIVDMEAVLILYSTLTYELFLWMLHFRNLGDHATFTLSHFCTVVKIRETVEVADGGLSALMGIKPGVVSKILQLQQDHPSMVADVEALGKDLEAFGLLPETTYQFIQGHTVLENVVLMILKPICNALMREKRAEIDAKAEQILIQIKTSHPELTEEAAKAKVKQAQVAERNQYNNHCIPIETLLRTHKDFANDVLFQKLQADLHRYVAEF